MIHYQYQILRYTHDQMSGEFVNVGVVLFSEEKKCLKAKISRRYRRISQFFSEVEGSYLVKNLAHIEKELNTLAEQVTKNTDLFHRHDSITQFTSHILPPDDSALAFSEPQKGLDLDLNSATEDLYQRMVGRYEKKRSSSPRSDERVWKEIYKKYFDQYKITQYLSPQSIETKNDKIEFEQTWKNGVRNCYQPISFDLKNKNKIKGKIYRWVGILDELNSASEPTHVYLLSVYPQEKALHHFIEDKLEGKSAENIRVTIVRENEAESFAQKQKQELEEYHKRQEIQ